MSVLDFAKSDVQSILRDNQGFSIIVTFTSPSNQSVDVFGHAMSHHLKFDTDGQAVSSKQTHISINEKDLTDLNYNVRNNRNKVALYKHRVSFIENNIMNHYVISETFPDETLGIITCILMEYKNA